VGWELGFRRGGGGVGIGREKRFCLDALFNWYRLAADE
jgi:hypothetical protein